MANNTHDDDTYADDAAEDSFVESDTDGQSDEWESSDDYSDEDVADDDLDAESEEEPAPKKKSKLGNVIIVVVVLVLAGAYFLLKGGHSPAPTGEAATNVAGAVDATGAPKEVDLQPSTDPAAAPQVAGKENEAPKDQGFMIDPTAQKSASVVEADKAAPVEPPAVTTIEATPPATPLPEIGKPTTNVVAVPTQDKAAHGPSGANIGGVAAAPEFPTVDKILKPQADVKTADVAPVKTETPAPADKAPDVAVKEAPKQAPTPEVAPVIAVTPPVAAPADVVPANPAVAEAPAIDAQSVKETDAYKSLASKLADEQNKVAELQKQLDSQKSSVAKKSTEDVDALKAKIGELEQKLVAKSDGDNTGDVDVVKAAPKTKAVKSVKSPSKSTVKPVLTKEPVASKPSVGGKWVLKAASPGRALIAHANGDDLKTVHVGDTIEPIGKILTIDIIGSGWKVQGTKGSISQ